MTCGKLGFGRNLVRAGDAGLLVLFFPRGVPQSDKPVIDPFIRVLPVQ